MSFSAAVQILEQIVADLTAPVTTLLPKVTITLDEPLTLVYTDLPSVSIYPMREEFLYDESFSDDKKQLSVRIEIRCTKGPASTVCAPIIEAIVTAIKADRTLGGTAQYVEPQTIQWANDITSSGAVCGASLDLQVNYLV